MCTKKEYDSFIDNLEKDAQDRQRPEDMYEIDVVQKLEKELSEELAKEIDKEIIESMIWEVNSIDTILIKNNSV